MSQMQKVLHERPQGALPSNTEPNPREQVNSIMTRSGLTTAEPYIPPPVTPTPRVEVEKEPETLMDEVHITSPGSTTHVPPPGFQLVSPPKPKEDPKPNPHQPKIPYPLRLNKTKLLDKNDVQVSKFLKILKQLLFYISLMDALTQIPKFTKVLKYLLKDKEKLEELANTPINVKCSVILLNKVPEKLDDPGKFLIPCFLQDLEVCNSLADSRASINLMPLSIYEKLGIGPLKPTRMTLELANRSVTFPMGIAKDVIVKVEIFNFLADFVIVDFEADPRVPIILGRPFLRTARALVDLYEEKLTLRVENEEVSQCSTTSHNVDFLPDYENNFFDTKEKSMQYTSHSDHSLPEYESFCFDVNHIEENSSGTTTSHSDISFPEYESFHFDLLIDPFPPVDRSDSHLEEFVDELAHIISPPEYDRFYIDIEPDPGKLTILFQENISEDSTKELTSPELNDLRLLLSDCDSIISKKFSENDLLVLFPSKNKDKVVIDSTSAGMSITISILSDPEIKTVSIKRSGTNMALSFVRIWVSSSTSLGLLTNILIDLPCLLVLITGTSQSNNYYGMSIHFLEHVDSLNSHHPFLQVDTSSIHIESRKSPTAELFVMTLEDFHSSV
ncbi:reverse transcriptase domain-containing protein [Tanacetum coccineum]